MELHFEFQAMGGVNEIRLEGLDSQQLTHAASLAIHEVRRIESKFSRYNKASVVSQVNAAAGSGLPVPLDDETAELLDFADRLFSISDGLFDITSGSLRHVWDFQNGVVASEEAIQVALPLVGWRKVIRQDDQIVLPLKGMELDFGGFGKEYAADRATELLQMANVTSGYVNLGGDIRVVGPHLDGSAWWLGVRDPRRTDKIVRTFPSTHGGLATSGDYERYFEHDGKRYCHLLNPKTGQPVNHWQSVSVLAPSCAAAGALTTIAMLSGAACLCFLEEQGAEYLAIDSAGTTHCNIR